MTLPPSTTGAPPRLVAADTAEAILPWYRGTPIDLLLGYHNLGVPLPASSGHAQLLISMCMDYRKELVVPAEFAYVLRSAGGSLRDSEFEVSYAIAVGGVQWLAILAHTDCGMADVTAKRNVFVRGLAERGGWSPEAAQAQFDHYATRYQIGDAVAFVAREARRLRSLYPRIQVAPLMYRVEDDRLMQVLEEEAGPTPLTARDARPPSERRS
jgi:carbonic anhydrase